MRLQDAHLHKLMDMLTSNEKAIQAMRTLDLDIDMRKLQNSGLDVISDPFFRSILLVKYEDGLSDLLHKTRIPIPTEQGRLLMGVVDESQRLLPGQVFIQYTDEIKKGTVLVKGPVMVTKNPCFHPGDLRCFLAVDCEELRHMVDCVVFPVQGDRPQPNEMAGADLDGDLYWTTWHPDLIIQDNHQPMDFPKVPSEQLDHQPTQQELIEYFCNYVMNDRLGIIANAHLALADSEEDGIFADKCLRLAELHSEAVDFPKTGHFPSVEMELRPTKYPDFMKKEDEAHYESERILGKMYQVVSYLSDSMHSQMKSVWKRDPASVNINHQLEPLVDEYLLSNPYYEKAQKYYQQYASKMQFLLNTYGLEEESHTMVISLYRFKQKMLTEEDLREQARIMKCRVNRLKKEYLDVLLNHDLETELLTKALLWYKVAYQDGKFKSFAWVALNLIPSGVWRDRIDRSIYHGIPCVEGTEEGQTNLRIQKRAFHQLEQAVRDRRPDLASMLHHMDLTIWNIEGNDIYVKLKSNANEDFEDFAREEFAQLCSVMSQLGIYQNDISFGNTGCYITKRGIEQRMTVDGCVVTAHLYLSGIYDEILNQVVRLLPTSKVFRVCFQYICRFWNQSAKPRLRGIISVLHIADMILHFLQVDSHFLRPIDAIHGFLQWCVVWENLKLLQGASPQLWSLSDELMRLLQLITLEHLQLLSLSAMCDPLHAQPDDGKKKRRVIPISYNVSKNLIGMEDYVCTTFSMRSGCTVSLKQVQNGKYYCYVAEGFGTERQLKRLLDEVRYFEFSFSVIEAPWAGYSMVFEGLTDDRDELQIVQYKGPTYLSSYEDSLYMVGIRERDQPSQEKGFLLPQHLDEVQRFLKTLRCYSGLYYQDKVRITCRFGCFHFASKGDIPAAMTASEFKRRIFSTTHDSFHYSSFACEVDPDGLKSFLVDKIGLLATKTEYRTFCEFNVDNRKVNIPLDEHCTMTAAPHQNVRLRCLQLIRTLPHLTGLQKKVDIRFQFQAMLPISQADDEWYNKIQSKPILEMEQHERGDMPLLSVCPEFRQLVKYVRQKKIMTYTFPEMTKQRHADHFTVRVKVDVSQVREYLNCDPKTGKPGEIKEGNEVTVVIPTAPPLHYLSEYCELMEKLVGLCEKISDFIL